VYQKIDYKPPLVKKNVAPTLSQERNKTRINEKLSQAHG
jgi:hypothetical protein